MYNYMIENTNPDCGVHYSCWTVRICISVDLGEGELLWVAFKPIAPYKIIYIQFLHKVIIAAEVVVNFPLLALYRTIHHIHFLHKVIVGKWSTCRMTSSRTLTQTVMYIIHAKPCICRSVHFGKENYCELILCLSLAVSKTISIHFLHQVSLGKWSTCRMSWLKTLSQTVVCTDYVEQ